MMGRIWVVMVCAAIICSLFLGKTAELSNAVIEGAKASVDLCLSIGGMLLLWSGVMEIMRRSGMMSLLSRFLSPALSRLFPATRRHPEIMEDLAANVSANLLGLGNAATPAGIRATQGLHRISGKQCASNELCMLVVINTASLQLIPTTIAAVRAAHGAANAYDILIPVWIASILAQSCGILAVYLFSRVWRDSEVIR